MAPRRPTRPVNARPGLRRSGPRPLALEPRILYDGAVVDAAASLISSAQHAVPMREAQSADHVATADRYVPAALEAPAPTAREIVFIDARVPDQDRVAAGARAGVQVVIVGADEDGFSVIDRTLAGRTEIAAIHVVTHGSPGEFILGSAVVNAQTLALRQNEVAGWSASLAAHADLLLYGCDVAGTTTGRALIDGLRVTSGADVAASVDDTGGSAGNWNLEYTTGTIEAQSFLTPAMQAQYDNRLSTVSLNGSTGWTAVMFGAAKDPVGDSQAGAADTDIVGDASHGSLYMAFDDKGTASTSDDSLVFRLRIDNPTSSSYFGGVAVVGLDANLDGRIDAFMSVDGRNNGQAVKLLDPGTGLNNSPSTTTTATLPSGWLPNNGVYSFSSSNYSVVAVSSATDPNWNGDNDLGNDSKTDAFVNWRIPLADLATVLAKPSAVDRNGNYGPRGASGIAGFTQNTTLQYVNFTQTQTGPINGDLNGVGSAYDKNATFSALGAITAPMSAAEPVAAGPTLTIDQPAGGSIGADGVWNASEDASVTLSGASSNLAQGTAVTVTVSDGSITRTGSGVVQSGGTWTATFAGGQSISGLADGSLTIQASADPDSNVGTSNDIHAGASILHDRTPPTVGINALGAAISGTPTFTGTSNLPDGALLTVTVDPDNNAATANLVYQVMVSGGLWSLNTTTVAPFSGSMPTGGLTSFTKVTATATDATGNSASAIALNRPTVTSLSTNSTAPILSGNWTSIAGDVLTVSVSGATYTLSPSGNSWSLDLSSATPSSGEPTPLTGGNSYSVTASVTRGGVTVSDTTSAELTITSTPVKSIDITGGATASGSDTTPAFTGTSGNAGGFVIVRLDPGNDGNLADAVTYSVVTDGSGNWALDTGSATPISGTVPTGGFVGAVGIRATDSTGAVADTQVLTISTPAVAVGSITSTASTDGFGQVSNTAGGETYLNITEDDSVTISGTATNGFTVDLVISDANGNSVTATGVAVTGGAWSKTGLNLSSLDNGTLTVKATLSGTSLSASNASVTHDKTPNQIFITSQTTIPKNQATISGSSSLGSGVGLTVTIRNAADTATVWTGTTTTTANGDWTVTTVNGTNLVGGSTGNVIIKVAPTSTNTDAAGNITQQVARSPQAVQNGSANSTDTIAIGVVATDGIITAGEIASGLTISGTTSLTTAATSAFTVTVSDGTTTQTATVNTNSAGSWSASLTQSQVQALKNGPLIVTAVVNNTTSGISVSDIELPVLSLATPALVITDDTPGTATGPVTFTFTFSEAMSGFAIGDITVTGGTKGTFSGSGTTYTLVVTPTASSSGTISVDVASSVATGTGSGRNNSAASGTQGFNTTGAAAPPTVTIDADALATSSTPVITGTTSLSAGAPILVSIDPDNDGTTSNSLTYSATVQSDGSWSVNVASAVPASGSLPADGLQRYAKITATATNAYGNSAVATALDKPTVVPQLTNDATPTISGTWANIPGDTLAVTVAPSGGGGGTTYTTVSGLVITGNSWSLTSASLVDGAYDVTATVTRGGATRTDISSAEVTVDTAASVDITGGATVSTNIATPVISGTSAGLATGTVLTLRIDTDNNGSYDLVYDTVVQAGGGWSVDTSTAAPRSGALPAGGLNSTTPLQATATDAAGNTGTDAQTLIVDATPPGIGITSPGRTPDSTPIIVGTTDLPGGSTITVNIDPDGDGDWSDQQTYSATVQPNGTWSVEATTPLTGSVRVRASGTDAVGNTMVTEAPLTIDVSAPTISVSPVATANSDFTADSSEDDAIAIAGTTTAVANGETIAVVITDGTITLSDTAIVSGGVWQLAPLNLSAFANGTITVTATFVDGGGNGYPATTSFLHDKSAVVAIDSISQDTGVVADFITKDATVSIFGSATASASVTVEVRNLSNTLVASFATAANGIGAWSTASTGTLVPGDYTIYATVGGTTVSHSLTIVDSVAPTLASSAPADNGTGVVVGDNLTLTFSKNVRAGSGFISLFRADGSLIENFNVATGVGDAGGTIVFNGSAALTLNPGHDLVAATGYYLHVDSSAVIDNAGNAYAGIANSTALNFATAALPGAPSQTLTIGSMTLDTGSSDFITADGSAGRSVAGTLSAGLGASEQVEVSFDGGSTWTAATTIGTNWTITDAASHSGNWAIEARVTNTTSSLSGVSAAQAVILDSASPSAPTVSSLDTTSTAPTLTGTASPGAGEALTVSVNGATYAVTPSGGSWSLDLASATPSSGTLGALSPGNSYAVTATVTDVAGNATSDVTTNELTIAANGPTQAVSIDSMTKDSGLSATDFLTADGSASRTVSGTLNASLGVNEIVEVSFNNGTTWTPATTSGTSWVVTDPGSHVTDWTLVARVANTSTQVSGTSSNQAVTLDATAPAIPTVNTLISTSTAPTLSGTAVVGSGETLIVTVNGATYAVTPVSGAWSLDLATAVPVTGVLGSLSIGSSYNVSAVVTDPAGNSTSDVTSAELAIEAVPPPPPVDPPPVDPPPVEPPVVEPPPVVVPPPVVTPPPVEPPPAVAPTRVVSIGSMTKDSGGSASDFITADGTAGRIVSGALDAPLGTDEVLDVSFDGGLSWLAATTSGGQWSVTDAGAHLQSWTLLARVRNSSTGLIGPVVSRQVVLDGSAPAAPTVNAIETQSLLPTLSGTAVAGTGDQLAVTVNSATYAVIVVNGTWTLNLAEAVPENGTLGALSAGQVYSVAASLTDIAGNSVADATAGELTIRPPVIPPLIDVAAPAVSSPVSVAGAPTASTPDLTTSVVLVTASNSAAPAPISTPGIFASASETTMSALLGATTISADSASATSLMQPVAGLGDAEATRTSSTASADRGLYTRSDGFQVIVLGQGTRAEGGDSNDQSKSALLVNRGIPDVRFDSAERRIEIAIPRDAFAHTRRDAVVSLTVVQADGAPLPAWLVFDPRLGLIRGTPPEGLRGDIEVRVIARDQNGNQVAITFRVRIADVRPHASVAPDAGVQGDTAALPAGKTAFTQQLRAANKWGGSGSRDTSPRLVASGKAGTRA